MGFSGLMSINQKKPPKLAVRWGKATFGIAGGAQKIY